MAKASTKSGGSGTGKSRSAITGRYVSSKFAQTHPKTTVTEGPSK